MRDFTRQPLTRTVAKGLRAATKDYKGEHQFRFTDLKELWISTDERHVLCTHHKDRTWQYWANSPDGWQLLSTHLTRNGAHNAALDAEAPEPQPESGTYVVATLGEGHRSIRVRCTSTNGPPILVDIFTRLGYMAGIEEVGEVVPLHNV